MQKLQSRFAAGRDTERQPKHARRRTADLQNSRLYGENACRLLQAENVSECRRGAHERRSSVMYFPLGVETGDGRRPFRTPN